MLLSIFSHFEKRNKNWFRARATWTMKCGKMPKLLFSALTVSSEITTWHRCLAIASRIQTHTHTTTQHSEREMDTVECNHQNELWLLHPVIIVVTTEQRPDEWTCWVNALARANAHTHTHTKHRVRCGTHCNCLDALCWPSGTLKLCSEL